MILKRKEKRKDDDDDDDDNDMNWLADIGCINKI
jgi:hypothetical protein